MLNVVSLVMWLTITAVGGTGGRQPAAHHHAGRQPPRPLPQVDRGPLRPPDAVVARTA